MLSSSSTKKTKEASKSVKDVLSENSSRIKDKHSENDQTISDVEKEYSRASSITEDTILVIIQNLDGTFFTLNVSPSDSVRNIKEMIKAKKGIDAYKYSLVCNCKELEDEKSVSDYGIQHDSFIRMLPFISNNVQFPVLNNYGKTHWIKINVNEPIKNLQTKIQNECGIPLDKQCFTCFDERTLSNGNCGMEEISNGIKEVQNDIAEIKSDLENEFGGTNDVNVQDNDFMGHESYHRDEDKMPVDLNSQYIASPSVEEDSDNDNDLIDECEESGAKEYNIVKKSSYERVKKESKGRTTDHVRIFTTDDKSKYYDLTWNARDNLFRCRPCISNHNEYVTAILIFLNDENGEECLQLNGRQHFCTQKTVQN